MTETMCYFLIENGLVVQKSYPTEKDWIEGPEFVTPGYLYVDGEFLAPPAPEPTREEILQSATARLAYLSAEANNRIYTLQQRVDALEDPTTKSMLTEEEKAELPIRSEELLAWKIYRILLGRVSGQKGWPADPVWPEKPQ